MDRTLTAEDAADYLKSSLSEVTNKAHRGLLPAAKISKRWVFLQSDLENHVHKEVEPMPRARRQRGFVPNLQSLLANNP